MWGYPTKVDKLKHLLEIKKIPLILDLAQAHCTKLNGNCLSFYGDISCFSTHDRKILATGEGGFVLTNNENLFNKIKSYIQFGNMKGDEFGLNFKLSSLQACIGSNRIDLIKRQLSLRKKNAKYIAKKISNPYVKEFEIVDNGDPNYYFMILRLTFSDNIKFINYLEEKGVPSDVLRYDYKVLYKYPLFKKYKKKCINSETLVKSFTTIPVHPHISKTMLDYMISAINNYKE